MGCVIEDWKGIHNDSYDFVHVFEDRLNGIKL